MVNFRNRGEQSLELGESIDVDVVTPMENLFKEQKGLLRKIQQDVQRISKACSSARKAHSKLSAKYGSVCMEAEQAAQSSVQSIAQAPAERARMAGRAVELALAARAAEREYYASISQANKARADYEQQMPTIQATLQDMQEKRTTCLREGLRKLAVYEMSCLRNLEYDLQAAFKAVEDSDPHKDLEDFIKRHQSESQEPASPTPLQVGVLPFWQLVKEKVPAADKSRAEGDADTEPSPLNTLQANVLPLWQMVKDKVQTTVQTNEKAKVDREAVEREAAERDAVCRQLVDSEFRPMAQSLVSEQPDTGCSQEVKEKAEAQILRMDEHPRRAAMCQAFRAEILSGEPPGAELDAAAHRNLPRSNFDIIVHMFTAALSACESQNDAWCGRDLMVLTQLFTTDGSSKPLTLLSQVYNHPLWSKVSFWEHALYVGLCEAHSAEAIWRRSFPPGSQLVSLPMTTFLQRLVGYMLAFGIRQDQAEKSVSATLKKYSWLFGPTTSDYLALLFHGYMVAKPADPPLSARGGSPDKATEAASTPGNAEARDGLPWDCGVDGNADSTAASASDDFEALAFGLPSTSAGSAEHGSNPNDSAQSGDDLGEDPALKELAAERPLEDVFA